jgi:hypothetical protein
MVCVLFCSGLAVSHVSNPSMAYSSSCSRRFCACICRLITPCWSAVTRGMHWPGLDNHHCACATVYVAAAALQASQGGPWALTVQALYLTHVVTLFDLHLTHKLPSLHTVCSIFG